MQRTAKLTLKEFAPAFNNCKPPTGWGKKIAVAYSGGVDSTCLLYLVNNLIKETEILKGSSLLAIHIDHNFRRTSAQDVDHCRKWAEKHSIAFSTYRIPWEMPPFSSLVITDRNKEEMGRVARYHAIFKVMKEENADVLLMAHHMDDQVETALMRQHRRKDDNAQTTLLGMAGMRPVRRWGMGNFPPHHMRYFGQEGMSRWICRPLLDFSKDRLIVTANEEKLAFVEDETNKDANLTERNAIRSGIVQAGQYPLLARPRYLFRHASYAQAGLELLAPDVVREYNTLRDDVDHAVDEYLRANRHFSPEGTFHLITSKDPPPPQVTQFGIIMRLLRHVSPFPWGSPYAEARRSTDQLSRIAWTLWPYSDEEKMKTYRSQGLYAARRKFAGGSRVLWHPTPTPGIPTPLIQGSDNTSNRVERTYGWLAQRQPPSRGQTAVLDITEKLRAREEFTILWDSRWICEFSENAIEAICDEDSLSRVMTEASARLVIAPRDQWWIPCIAFSDGLDTQRPHLTPLTSSYRPSPSVVMTFVRPIDAI